MLIMSSILIIGSKGFIGSWVYDHFSSRADTDVYGCDVVVDYESSNYFLIDASNADYDSLFRNQKFDCCINCSGAASVPDSIKNPSRDYELNTHNVFKLLDSIRKHNAKCKFVNMSSAAVYGNPESLPIVEDQGLRPVSPYGNHKLMAEMICKEYSVHYGLHTVSLRIFSAYGEGLKKQLFWDLNKKVLNEEAVNLWGTGRESRDFIHVQDLIQIIELVIDKAAFYGECINAANGTEVYIEDAVATFYGNYKADVAYSFSGQGRKGDPSNWVADISKIRDFGYVQSISFEDGIGRYYDWVMNQKMR